MNDEMRCKLAIAGALLALSAPGEARAQAPTATPDRPFVALLTMAPGTHPFLLFGHSALWVHDPRQASREDVDVVYNFGTFEFGSPWVIPRFMVGRLWYWLSVDSLDNTLRVYGGEGRGIRAQVLQLPGAERDALLARLSRQALPEHRSYRYDFFRDNCATRPRDQIDQALGGRLRAATRRPAALGFRQQVRRMARVNPPVLAAADLLLGPAADAPVTAWDELFLPENLRDALDDRGLSAEGSEGPLVERAFDLLPPGPPSSPAPPSLWGTAALLGLAGGGPPVALARAALRWRRARALLGLWIGVLGSLLGLVGALLLWFTLATDVAATQRNATVLACTPLGLALGWRALRIARGEPRATAQAARWTAWMAALAAGSAALRWLSGQGGGELTLALLLLWAGWALALGWRPAHFGGGVAKGDPAEDDTDAEAPGVPGGGGGGRSR